MKYHTPKSEYKILPNKLGLTDPEKIAAVQAATDKGYQPMNQLFRSLKK